MADGNRHCGASQRNLGRQAGQHRQQHEAPEPTAPSIKSFLGQPDPENDPSVYQDMRDVALMQECLQGLRFGYGNGMNNPAKDRASSATSGSLLSVGSSSVFVESVSGSMMEVHHKRTYSGNSNRTSGASSDGRHFSVPDEAEWNPGTEPVMSVEPPDEDTLSAPHDPQYILSNMFNVQPRTIPNPYHSFVVPDDRESSYHNSSNYAFNSRSQPYESEPSATSARLLNRMTDPWNPVDPQVSEYSPGFVAFAPSPGPAATQYQEETTGTSLGAPSPSGSNRSARSRERKANHSKSPAKGKGKSRFVGWENITVSNGGLTLMVENTEAPPHRSGVRRGKLGPEAAERARKIRKLRACWNCWIQKIPCSEGETCDKCRRLSSPLTDQLCCRAGLKDHIETFFPDFLHKHLKRREIEEFISEHTSGFNNTAFEVKVSVGEVFLPMVLVVNMFYRKGGELLRQTRLAKDDNQNMQIFDAYSAPVGLLGLEREEMRSICTAHIEKMVKNPRYPAQATAGDTSQLPCSILEIIMQYSASKAVPLLRNALKLHAIHYFMKSLITFSHDSAEEIYRSLVTFSEDFAEDVYGYLVRNDVPQHLSSRLLNRQIKHIMHQLHRDLTTEVLKGLEKSLRTRTRDSWGPSFCTILVLSLCIENLQTAADTMVVCDMRKLGAQSKLTRNQSIDTCSDLDRYPFEQCKRLFHEIYRSHKEGNGGARDGGFNPLKAIQDDEKTNLDPETDMMLRAMYDTICSSTGEITDLAERKAVINTVDPEVIRHNNNGRLASRFLRSFFVEV